MKTAKQLILAAWLMTLLCLTALAQSNTGRLVGSVASPDGAISGATIVITDNQTNKERTITAAADGTFTVPQLEVGTYSVKVAVSGFKAFTATDVKIDIGREYSLPIVLQVGDVADAVTVTAGADVLNAVTGELSNTVSQKQILDLPLNGRNPLNLIGLQPGVASNSAQGTSINGLRTSFTNITRDGLNIQDGFIRSNATDFAPGRPSVDDTGEFTVVTQNAGADQSGGAQVRLVTPRGETKFHGALFEFNRNSALAANDFFSNAADLPVPFLNRNNFGGKLGGPMPIPRFGEGGPATFSNKGFFFFAYEGLRQRSQSLRDRTILTPSARQGIFTYTATQTGALPANCNDSTRRCTVNIFALNPLVTGADPIVASRLLSLLPAVANRTDIGDQLNTTGFSFRQPDNQDRNSYTTRLDYDISEKHTLNGVFTYNKENNLRPDVDGGEGFTPIPVTVQSSTNKLFVLAYRATPTARFTNEARGGLFRSDVPFDRTTDIPAFFLGSGNVLPLISNPEVTFLSQGRNTSYYNFQDNAELNISNHAVRFGGQLQFQKVDSYNQGGIVPNFNLGTNPNTPNLSAGQFPGGISNAQLTTGNNLLALLGGIVSSGSQSYNVASQESGFQPVQRLEPFRYGNHSLYVQDQWRARPSLTLNLGLRYELYTALELANGLALEPVIPDGSDPVQAVLNPNGTYNFLGGNAGQDNRYYKTDKNNFAPIISVAYSPRISNNLLKSFLGENQFVVRGGYRISYLNDQMITALRNAATGNVGLGTTTFNAINTATNTAQLNLNVSRDLPIGIGTPGLQPTVPRTFAQNNTAAFSNFGTVFGIDPEIQTPRVEEYNFGIQREFGANAIEIRYVGTRSNNLWRSIDYNQIDIRNNGFLNDFQRARNNLLVNEAERARLQATGLTLAQVNAQLPLSAAFNSALAGSQQLTVFPTLAAGGNLTNAANINQIRNGTPADLALVYIQGAQTGTARFLANPNSGVVNLFTNGSILRYNSLQAEFRRRFTQGLYFQANYTFQKTLSNGVGTSQFLVEPFLDNSQPRLEYSRADYDQAHLFKANAVYELPFGRNRQFFGNVNRAVDILIGGWQVNTIVNVGTGAPITITDPRGTLNRAGRSGRQTAFSRLTKEEIKELIGIRRTPNGVLFIDPAVINSTGRAAEGFGSTPFAGQAFFNVEPGQTGNLDRAFINGPLYFNVDASLFKNISITESVRVQLRLEAFNALNRTNFSVSAGQQLSLFNINSATFGRINQTFPGRIIQLGARLDF